MRTTPKYPIVTAGSMAGNITSSQIPLNQDFGFNIQITWTGTPVGILDVQASDDGVTYISILDAPVSTVGISKYMFNVSNPQYEFAQLVYTSTSGTGTMTAIVSIKGF